MAAAKGEKGICLHSAKKMHESGCTDKSAHVRRWPFHAAWGNRELEMCPSLSLSGSYRAKKVNQVRTKELLRGLDVIVYKRGSESP